MAKRKKSTSEKKSTGIKIDLIAILLILIAIIGLGNFGIIGNFIRAFAAFLVGNLYAVLLLSLFIIGVYTIFKKSAPNFFTGKLLGFYIMTFSLLIICHLYGGYFNDFEPTTYGQTLSNVWKLTIDQWASFIETTNLFRGDLGGGVLGFFFSVSAVHLLDIQGAVIVSIVVLACGFTIMSGVSILELIRNGLENAKEVGTKVKEAKATKEVKNIEDAYEKDNKVIVQSMEEVIQYDKKTGEVIEKSARNYEETPREYNKIEYNEGDYKYPSVNLLSIPTKTNSKENESAVKENIPILESVLSDFGIECSVVAAHVGPAVTQYELEIKKSGTKVNRILSLNKEIALALAAKEVRIQAPIPGKSTIGIELPNKSISPVTLRELIEPTLGNLDSKLLCALGKDIMGENKTFEINKTPHLLVAGSTGSGKSVCINSFLISILMRTKPNEVKLVLIDPKKVELSMYNGIPHLITPVVTDPKKANVALKKIVAEMDRRYEIFESSGTKNIAGYNAYIEKKNEFSEEKIAKLPYIVVIIDELADLMLVAAKEVEDSILRITQMARAAGIHLIVATQRPSTDVITGVVKANIPSRISFAVSSSIDSRTILDMTGAEKLLGKGDMLFKPQDENTPVRIQGTFVSDEEIKKIVDHTIKQQKAHYDETFLMDDEEMGATTMLDGVSDGNEEPLYNEIVEFVVSQGKASASLLQRRFRLGYNRAARAIDILESRGIVGPSNGSKPREVLVKLSSNDDYEDEE